MDPRMKAGEDALEEALEEPVAFAGTIPSVDELVGIESVEGLLELAAVYRAGVGVERDLFKALECFEAASRLGNADAEYLVGVALFNGLGIAADQAEGAKRLRSAAQRGSLRAKVYVANLYEIGVHYAADREKADVWYRYVARAASIEDEPDTDAYELAMAEIGSVRYCLVMVADASLPKKDRAFYLKKAKAMGYAHRLREAQRATEVSSEERAAAASRESAEPSSDSPEEAPEPSATQPSATQPSATRPGEGAVAGGKDASADDAPAPLASRWTFGAGVLAFLVAAFFAATSTAAAFLALEGSRALLHQGRGVPSLGAHHQIVAFAVLFCLGVLPTAAVYRPRVVAIAAVAGVASAVGGYFAHASQPLLWDAWAQSGAAGMSGFLLVVLFLGVLGGTRFRAR